MPGKPSTIQILSIGFLIVGNLIGAGILALPINTGLAGFIPAMAGLFLTSAAMYYSSVILSREAVATRESNFNYPSLYRKHLGEAGKWIAVVANLIILYGLLTAYLTGISTIIVSLFKLSIKPAWIIIGYFTVTLIISLASISRLMKYIAVLVVIKCAVFFVIAAMAGIHIQPQNLTHTNWPLFVCGIPILVTAFHFHNIIPAICEQLSWDQKTISRTMLLGMVMGFLMNGAWLLVGIGVLPLDNSPIGLITAFQKNLPATIPLASAIGSQTFLVLALSFAIVSITTAYLSNAMGLIGFMDDLTSQYRDNASPLLSRVLALGPPIIISIVYPDVFLKAIDIAGGFGIVTLFGILPSIIAIRKGASGMEKGIGYAMLAIFAVFLLLEFAQEFGLLNMAAELEHWNPRH